MPRPSYEKAKRMRHASSVAYITDYSSNPKVLPRRLLFWRESRMSICLFKYKNALLAGGN